MIGTHLLGRVKHARQAFRAMQSKSPTYLRLFHEDVLKLREELLRSAIGLAVGAVAGLLFIGFSSLAILVTAWDTRARLEVAWGLAIAWAIVALGGLIYARSALRMGVPFATLVPILQRDLAAIEKDPT